MSESLGKVAGGSPQTLDALLYGWLCEPNDERFELRFAAYFRQAFPAVVRYLRSRHHSSVVDIEGVAQNALLAFFHHVGIQRRQALSLIREGLANATPMAATPLHARRLALWIGLIHAFVVRAISFEIRDRAELSRTRAELEDINAKIPSLQRQGLTFVEVLASNVAAARAILEMAHIALFEVTGSVARRHRALCSAIDQFSEMGSAGFDSMAQVKGSHTCGCAVCMVVANLPNARVHSNSLLFEIARNRYIDESRRLAKHLCNNDASDELDDDDRTDSHSYSSADALLENSSPDDDSVTSAKVDIRTSNSTAEGELSKPNGPNDEDDEDGGRYYSFQSDGAEGSNPADAYVTQELFERCFERLSAPVRNAELAITLAHIPSELAEGRHRLARERAKLERVENVLLGMAEGFTQEEMAEKLSLSRNQIKYAVELARETLAGLSTERNERNAVEE